MTIKKNDLSEVDGYSAEWAVSAFKDCGIRYERADKNKSALYLEALPLFMRGAIRIPDLPVLTRELRLLERQTHRSGRDTVDHGRHGMDIRKRVVRLRGVCDRQGQICI